MEDSFLMKIKGTKKFIGSPSLIKKVGTTGLWVNYTENENLAACFTQKQFEELFMNFPLKKECIELVRFKT